MHKSWSKGLTKETHPSIMKISQTMRKRKIDNFREWREKAKEKGLIRTVYKIPEKNGDLAELMGCILGDGHIYKFPRTEELSIFSNSNNSGFIKRYSDLIERMFKHKPSITKHGKKNCTRIRIYEKNIATRLNMPYSPRGKLKIVIPRWVLREKEFVVRYLRGLYEAEGSFSVHKPTSTYKASFSNANESMLDNVFRLVKKLGFHPHRDALRVQISRKAEVLGFLKLIEFRKY